MPTTKPRPKPEPPADRLLNVHEVARRTGFPSASLYQYRTRPHLPQPIMVAGRLRWIEKNVQEWIDDAIAAA